MPEKSVIVAELEDALVTTTVLRATLPMATAPKLWSSGDTVNATVVGGGVVVAAPSMAAIDWTFAFFSHPETTIMAVADITRNDVFKLIAEIDFNLPKVTND
jgi:hypothetical protein